MKFEVNTNKVFRNMKRADNFKKKLLKEFMKEHPVYNQNRLTKISKKLGLPIWWVELVAIEYFDCRRFLEGGKATVFDFGIFDKSLVNTIKNYKVVIPSGHIFFQNVRPDDFSYRTPALMVGAYVEPLDKADLIPEGIMSFNAFPFSGNHISISDPKEDFNWYAIVFDDYRFYQWKIAELYEINEKSNWFKSDLFDLLPLWELNRQIYDCKNKISNSEVNQEDVKNQLINLYSKLERAREPLRKKVLEYHNEKKKSINNSTIIDHAPPLLTFIDTLRPTTQGYVIESHLESLFYSASLENCLKAEESRAKQNDSSLTHETLLEEIKYSALCIICVVMTLESYINFVFSKYLPNDSKVFERSSPQQKWLYVPHALSLPYRFSSTGSPYKVFLDLISWRNRAIHHTPEFTRARIHKSKQRKSLVSATYSMFNLENAKLAIKCEQEMILKLSEGGTIPVPKWIHKVI